MQNTVLYSKSHSPEFPNQRSAKQNRISYADNWEKDYD